MITGIQVSSLKPLLRSPNQVREAFEKIRAIGCDTVQLQWIDPSVPVEYIVETVQNCGLRSVSVQDFYQTVVENKDYYYGLNGKTGGIWVCVSRIPDRLKSRPGLDKFAQELKAMASDLEAIGQKLCFHPVCADFAPIEGVNPVEYLLDAVPQMEICFDLYHLNKAGYNMPQTLRRYAGRVCMVHFKEGRRNPDGTETLVPAGQGDMDWSGVKEACEETGVPYAFVEQERWDRNPYDCLQEALTWAASRR